MKALIEKYLTACGYTNITWHKGRNGYYVLAQRNNATLCYNVGEMADELVWLEETYHVKMEV